MGMGIFFMGMGGDGEFLTGWGWVKFDDDGNSLIYHTSLSTSYCPHNTTELAF